MYLMNLVGKKRQRIIELEEEAKVDEEVIAHLVARNKELLAALKEVRSLSDDTEPLEAQSICYRADALIANVEKG